MCASPAVHSGSAHGGRQTLYDRSRISCRMWLGRRQAIGVSVDRSGAMRTSAQVQKQGTQALELRGHQLQLLGAARRTVLPVERPQPEQKHAEAEGQLTSERRRVSCGGRGRGTLAHVKSRCQISVSNIEAVAEELGHQRLEHINEARQVRELQRLREAAASASRANSEQEQRSGEQLNATLRHGAALYYQLFQRHYDRLEKRARGEILSDTDTEEDCS